MNYKYKSFLQISLWYEITEIVKKSTDYMSKIVEKHNPITNC